MAKETTRSRRGVPTLEPPERATRDEGATAAETQARPRDLTDDLFGAMLEAAESAQEAPALTPPEAAFAEQGVLAWQSDKRVNALWSINQTRNTWLSVTGIGWKKLMNGSDSAVTAMTILASHAKQTQCRLDYRDEADGLVREIYVW